MADAMAMNSNARASLEARLMEQLRHADEGTLYQMEALLAPADAPAPSRGLTRRKVLALLGLGGAAAVSVGGAGISALLVSNSSPEAPAANAPFVPVPAAEPTAAAPAFPDLRGAVSQLTGQNQALTTELQSATGLMALYQELDELGLDRIVESGLGLVGMALERAGSGAAGLREGLRLAEQRLSELDQSFAGLDTGLARAEQGITGLSNMMQTLEDRLRAAGEPVAPITEALGGFFKGLIERIPGVGPRIIEAIEHVEAIIGAIPQSIENINSDLIRPLRERFFPQQGDTVQVRLLDPIAAAIVAPADALLGALSDLSSTWQSALQQPAQETLAKRAEVRQKIAAAKGDSPS